MKRETRSTTAGDPPTRDADRDRRVHAGALVVIGTNHGLYAAVHDISTGAALMTVTGMLTAASIGAVVAVTRRDSAVPHDVRRSWWLGVGGSLVLALAVVRPWLQLELYAGTSAWVLRVIAALVVAAPCLAAAAAVQRRG
jgi:phosphoribosylformylglycinamidine (FGAM) synthase-like enzyme